MSKNYQAIEGGYGSVPVTPVMVGAADRIRTGDGQLGKPPKGHTRISRALLLHSLTSWTESVDSSRSPLRSVPALLGPGRYTPDAPPFPFDGHMGSGVFRGDPPHAKGGRWATSHLCRLRIGAGFYPSLAGLSPAVSSPGTF